MNLSFWKTSVYCSPSSSCWDVIGLLWKIGDYQMKGKAGHLSDCTVPSEPHSAAAAVPAFRVSIWNLYSNAAGTHAFFHMCMVLCGVNEHSCNLDASILSLCSHIGLLYKSRCFWGWAEAAFDLCVRLKIEVLWVGLFLEYTFKMIQNIQWSKGEHWPSLHLSFINFLSVQWARSERRAWLRNGSRAIHKGETRSLRFWFTGTHLSVRVCGVVGKKGALLQSWGHRCYMWDNATVRKDTAALFYCDVKAAVWPLKPFKVMPDRVISLKLEFEQMSTLTAPALLLHTTPATTCLLIPSPVTIILSSFSRDFPANRISFHRNILVHRV